MDLSEHPKFLMVFMGIWVLTAIYIGSVLLLSFILAGERRRGERTGGPSFPSADPLDAFRMLKFIFTASSSRGESSRVMQTVWLVRVLFVASAIGILGVMAWGYRLGM